MAPDYNGPTNRLLVADLQDPLRPTYLCELQYAAGGRFISATQIAFWEGRELETLDLRSGAINITGELPVSPTGGAFSADGTAFAYVAGSFESDETTHLYRGGVDKLLVTRPAVGGHGDTPGGPAAQLAFSADGGFLLAVRLYANPGALPRFLIFSADGSLVYQSDTAAFGIWAPSGSTLYFLDTTQQGGISGAVHRWDRANGELKVSSAINSYYWPAMSPDGRFAVFDSLNMSLADCGAPQLWRIDLTSGATTQLSKAITTRGVFVRAGTIWSDEEQVIPCGPGGSSVADGKVVAHDLASGQESVVDLELFGAPTWGPLSIVQDVRLG